MCTWIQKAGTLVLIAMSVFLTVGALLFMIIFLKFRSDLKFATVLKTVLRIRVIRPVIYWWYEFRSYSRNWCLFYCPFMFFLCCEKRHKTRKVVIK